MLEIIQPYIGEAITALIGGVAGWFFTRKKQHAELQANELDNVDKAVKIYREVADDLSKQLKTAITELNEAKKELDEARQTIKELEEKVEALTHELTKYKQLNGKAKV
ncbi:cell wall anchor protein [Ornithobacterium rhinotracheale]|uniref:cell wall anchor protein n=1 Tax=Ornithobacterium rhinotracheale TaxID=28251 RepID=UPI00129C4A3F|nr:cell wall anchor protein [Ornithobacterium rhinotracheale]MRJ11536.1 cell wall anchor protein [Ornithobacterium rhinotracheale]